MWGKAPIIIGCKRSAKILYACTLPFDTLFWGFSQRSGGSHDGPTAKWLRNMSCSLATPECLSRYCSRSESLYNDSITIRSTCQGPISELCGDGGLARFATETDGESHQCCKYSHDSPPRLRLSLIARIACRAFSGLTTE